MLQIVALCLIAVVAAAPPPRVTYSTDNVQLLKFENDNDGTGNYRYTYEQTDGQKQEEQGEVRNGGTENEYIAVRGAYSWVGPDGVTYTVTYVADENGFQPDIEQGPGGAVPAHIASLLGCVTYTVTYVADKNGFPPDIEQGPGGVKIPNLIQTDGYGEVTDTFMFQLVVLALVSVAAAAPQRAARAAPSSSDVQLLRYDSDNDGLGTYSFAYEQSDGSKRNEAGELRNAGTDDESIAVKGSYTWTGPDGVTYTVTFIADDNGFQPTIEQGPGGAVPPGVIASLVG
ncbi:uncharacterized protein [Epargyreus clarus]|uniref:uncharacterized protein n=1 Tax=Epargyreus clarus TaxID=520877 RepID=UPI003C300B66